jgi:hypothetical protein
VTAKICLSIRSAKQIVTPTARPHSIAYVPVQMRSQGRTRRPEIALTKRRAVDFCRVATAICPAAPLSRAR